MNLLIRASKVGTLLLLLLNGLSPIKAMAEYSTRERRRPPTSQTIEYRTTDPVLFTCQRTALRRSDKNIDKTCREYEKKVAQRNKQLTIRKQQDMVRCMMNEGCSGTQNDNSNPHPARWIQTAQSTVSIGTGVSVVAKATGAKFLALAAPTAKYFVPLAMGYVGTRFLRHSMVRNTRIRQDNLFQQNKENAKKALRLSKEQKDQVRESLNREQAICKSKNRKWQVLEIAPGSNRATTPLTLPGTNIKLGRCTEIPLKASRNTSNQLAAEKKKCEKEGGKWKQNLQSGVNNSGSHYCDKQPKNRNTSNTPSQTKPISFSPKQTPIAEELAELKTANPENQISKGKRQNKSNAKTTKNTNKSNNTQHGIMLKYLEKSIKQTKNEHKKFGKLIEADIASAKEFIEIQNQINAIKFEMLRLQHQTGTQVQEEYNKMARNLTDINSKLRRTTSRRINRSRGYIR